MMNLEGKKKKKEFRFILHHLDLNSWYHFPQGKEGWYSNMPEFHVGIMKWTILYLVTLMLTPLPKGSVHENNNQTYGNG